MWSDFVIKRISFRCRAFCEEEDIGGLDFKGFSVENTLANIMIRRWGFGFGGFWRMNWI